MKKIKLLATISLCVLSLQIFGQISGTVFRDFNANGVKDNTATYNEPFVSGVTITAYPTSGATQTTTTSASGAYIFTGLVLPVRLEFSSYSTSDFSAPIGAGNKTSVQFHTSGTTTANFGVHYPGDFCHTENPDVAITNFNNGASSSNTNASLLKFPFNANTSSTGSLSTTLGTSQSIGSTWGVAYQKSSNKIYSSAFIKRHVGLKDNNGDGFGDIGAIYVHNSTSNTNSLFLNLQTLGVNLGTVAADATRGLTGGTSPSQDATVLDKVCKEGLGDLDISEDEKYLYTINLFTKELIRIVIDADNNPSTAPTMSDIQSFALPSGGCTNGQLRPFGLGVRNGKVYVGAICSAENGGTNSNLTAIVFEFDGILFTPILSFPLNYDRGVNNEPPFSSITKWLPWTSSATTFFNTYKQSDNTFSYPHPVLCDIDFETDNQMVLAFFDRGGHMGGVDNYATFDTNPSWVYVGGGDILTAYKNGTNWTIENNGDKDGVGPYNAISSQTNNQGPGGGEFYYNDNYQNLHQEIITGGMSILKGASQVAIAGFDTYSLSEGGTFRFSLDNGSRLGAYKIYDSDPYFAGPDISFGKANGLGDLEMLCNPAPIEIGNRVWMDSDNDGVQDADEMGLDGIPVKLYNGTTLVSTKTTINGGQYYFDTTDGVVPNTSYTIRIEGASFPSGKFVTLKDQTTGGIQDLGDNDASLIGVNADISYTTGSAGENNHTLDFGFSATPTVSCQPDSIKICAGQSVELEAPDGYSNYIWYKINGPGDTVQVATGQTYTTSIKGNYIFKANDSNGCPASLCCPVTVADSNCCVINNVNLVIGTCDNKGTLSNANDDEYTFTLNPTGNGIGTTYTVNGLPNSPQTGTYGSPTTFGPYLISSGVLNISVVDNVSNTCSKTVSVTPPPSCSVCNVSPPVLVVTDNICPNRTGSINLVQGCGIGTIIEYSTNNGLTWSSAKPLYTTTAKTILARCVNSADNNCKSVDASVTTDPKKCPDGGSNCMVIATTTVDPCQDNGTGDVATDDYFTIQVNASASNGGSSQRFEVVIGASLPSGLGGNVLNSGGTLYGSPVTVGQNKQFKADGSSSYVLIVRDIDNKSCFQQVNITPVAPCSSLPPKSPCYPVPCVPIGLQKN